MTQKNFYKALAIAGAVIIIISAFASIVQAKELEIPVEAPEASQDCEVTINFANSSFPWRKMQDVTISEFQDGTILLSLSPTGYSWRVNGFYGSGTVVPRGTVIPFEPVLIHSWSTTCGGNPQMTAEVNYFSGRTMEGIRVSQERGMRGLIGAIPFRGRSLITTTEYKLSYVLIKIQGLK